MTLIMTRSFGSRSDTAGEGLPTRGSRGVRAHGPHAFADSGATKAIATSHSAPHCGSNRHRVELGAFCRRRIGKPARHSGTRSFCYTDNDTAHNNSATFSQRGEWTSAIDLRRHWNSLSQRCGALQLWRGVIENSLASALAKRLLSERWPL